VLAALGEAEWSEVVVVGSVQCAIDGTVICALDDALSLFLLLLLEVDFIDTLGTGEVSAAAGDMIQKSLTQLPVMGIDGDNMEHLPHRNVDGYLAVSN